MRKFQAALFSCLVALLLVAGCAEPQGSGGKGAAPPSAVGQTEQEAQRIALPPSPQYTASYAINDGSAELSKTVWRKPDALRMQYSASGKVFMDLFFLSGKAYSCSSWKGNPECFEVSSQGGEMGRLFEAPDFSSSEPDEEVDIGGTKGVCYLFPYTVGTKRKMCFTDRGVVAYD